MTIASRHCYSTRAIGVEYFLQVCLSVCLRVYFSSHVSKLPRNFQCALPVAVTWSSFGSIAVCYVFQFCG